MGSGSRTQEKTAFFESRRPCKQAGLLGASRAISYGSVSASEISIFVRIDKKVPNRGARVAVTKYESRRLSFRLSGREKLPLVPAEYRPWPPRN